MTQRLLLKLGPQASQRAAVNSTANIRPLFDQPGPSRGLSGAPGWFLADAPGLAPGWDGAHSKDAFGALGLDSQSVLLAEPDLQNEIFRDATPQKSVDCSSPLAQNSSKGALGDGFAWHLRGEFSQLAAARDAVTFTDPRIRIAHIDTGYDPSHDARPARILHDLERNFTAQGDPGNAADPNRRQLFDTSGHGTGTIGILAGHNLGGAPDADILPIRIADSVVLFFTSALAQGFQYAVDQRADVISISMGGLPSEAWNDTVNAAYEQGICIVAASGDCIGGFPTHHVVYPARYHRTLAACGVMSNRQPYYGISPPEIEGSWGPPSCMTAALSAWTPNIPWARLGCPSTLDLDGGGTSAATPQIAAAAALYFEKYKSQLPRDWRRVEAVRNALFQSAIQLNRDYLGNGILQAAQALTVLPRLDCAKTPPDDDSFAFFRIITGLGLSDEPSPRERMLRLELAQRYLLNSDLQDSVPDPAVDVPVRARRRFFDALVGDPQASQALRRLAAARASAIFGPSSVPVSSGPVIPPRAFTEPDPNCRIPTPHQRSIRTYAVDPSLSTRLDTAQLNEGVLHVPWEAELKPGPVGNYVAVVDRDTDGTVYSPVDLNDPLLLAQDGFAPSESNPQFHQQMVYAVAMTTITHFEKAIGRSVLWRPVLNPLDKYDDSQFVPQLTIHPHAFRQENAYYNPVDVALHFGYFEAHADDPGDHVPGSTIFTCLSHDIVAHETTHAILDGMHRRFNEPTNPDVLAFHEAFADIVALMQHFTMIEVLENQIQRARGDLASETLLGALAIQFGRAIGQRGALRDAIGSVDPSTGAWTRQQPDPTLYSKLMSPHARGALLVAAVFDAFLAIYKARTADLLRIYTGGTGVLQPGAIHPDMVRRLAAEAATSAAHVLRLCIRALDYVPPVDITFGEYLRALITADADFVPDDTFGYRVAFIEAFRRRGIRPSDVRNMSVESLRWRGQDVADPNGALLSIVANLKKLADEMLYISDRRKLFDRTRLARAVLHRQVEQLLAANPDFYWLFGLEANRCFEMHALRRAERKGTNGCASPQVIVSLTQDTPIQIDGSPQPFTFYGGSTLIVDLTQPRLLYAIRKRINHAQRKQDTVDFLRTTMQNPLMSILLDPSRADRFGALHALSDLEG